ncbi:hypothetical protein GLOIN_2v1779674 [Rhizophagus irregularis DAOM 181602=DAOM 197198]|uniref:Uncharacterized protein n=1 Tax=Rhizophagus irregularis (strain DAOM 181602 / DAOM 197198 / MUCL 43194) TaxID=747089 RepID=A0A2P4PPB9_RHIID|nr:hypothetical protein GLOIN_2v1779674 [Rhizophagus irregularis DAOM 181602=DAOM 197198]POG67239.1 hypothetical protein GLOIN_2v1779674 [Rhizophagus irregularis DAOM 181602=DAOM 197198]GBC53611.2 hypothetical protein GLOIN_2v1779674 [Rhizophagus irregularis DAOM 181602=DAOM 197198]|eukprot:XP_025174105.1 hypothetical protein GLOIN_2v1779674 [Rhizophagus irregularis DAOM 181602=DAOM 197198]
MAKLTLDVAKEIARSRGGECISERYVNCQIPMLWKCAKDHLWSARLTSTGSSCKEGHKWKASAKDILKGTWCRRCSKPGRKRVIPSRKIIPVQEHITPEQECTPIQRHNTQNRKRRQR